MRPSIVPWLGLFCFSACTADPELQAARAALQSWDAAVSTDRADVARQHLEDALQNDPSSPALRRALARRQAELGDLSAAVATLNEGIPAQPTPAHLPLLRDRAAVHAQAGDPDRAAADLRTCIALGTDPRALGADPAYATLAAHPAHSGLVPRVLLTAAATSASPKALVGETWTLTLRVEGPPGDLSLGLSGGPPAGLQLHEVVEDIVQQDAFALRRTIRLEWRVLESGSHRLPPISVQLADQATTLPSQIMQGVALGTTPRSAAQEQGAATGSTYLPVPSTLEVDHPPGERHVATDAVWVRAEAHWTCTLRPRPPNAVRLVRRAAGQPRWSGWWLESATPTTWRCPQEGISLRLP